MTAVSNSTLPSNPIRVPPASAPRMGDAADAAPVPAKSSAVLDDSSQPLAPTLAHVATAAGAAPAAAASAKTLSKEEIAKQVHELQAKMDKLNPALTFVVDKDSGRALIQLTDRATKEVILQFPSEAALQISKALDQFQKGQLISRIV